MVIFKAGLVALFLLLCALTGRAQRTGEDNLVEMITAENNFAKMVSETSIKAAFLANLDRDGVVFNGGSPSNGIALYTKLKEGTDLLSWYPVAGQVSADGNLGFTSGPYQYAPDKHGEAVSSGYFFSIWKRDADGVFKVILDIGSQHSKGHMDVFNKNPKPADIHAYGKSLAVENVRKELPWESETMFAKLAEKDPVSASRQFLAETSLVSRSDQKIGRNKSQNLDLIESEKITSQSYRQLGNGIAATQDFAYCYGEIKQSSAGKEQNGFYVRVWQFQKGGWKIIADQLAF